MKKRKLCDEKIHGKLLKEAMWDKFEELRDRELIAAYEKKSRAGKVQFENAEELIRKIEKKRKVAVRGSLTR